MKVYSCPSCGYGVKPVNPGITVMACPRCDTLLYLEGEVISAGKRAILGEPVGPVAVGAEGRVDGQPVEIVGRVRLSYGDGFWDEWYLGEREGAPEWLVEDEKRYALEAPVPVPEGAHSGLRLGEALRFDGRTYEVREVGEAVLEGVEGQVPRTVEPGQAFRYVDLSEVDGPGVLLLEFDPDGGVEAFAGEAVAAEDVDLHGGRRRAAAAKREAHTIRCPNCGAPYTPPQRGEPPVTASCASCDAVLELDEAQAVVVGHRDRSITFDLEIGDRGELLGTTWEVVGRCVWMDEEGYRSDEFLLWSEDEGYLWLEKDNGHYAWTKPLEEVPSVATFRTMEVGEGCSIGGRRMELMARGRARLHYVDGALPWAAKIDDSHEALDFASAPHVANVELSDSEVEAFAGEWLSSEEVLAAFGRSSRWRQPRGVHIGQPNPYQASSRAASLLLLLIAFNFAMWWMPVTGEKVAAFTIPAAAIGGQSVESPPFELDPEIGGVTAITFHSEIDNSWVWVDLGLVDDETDQEFGYIGSEIEYYYGYEGRESWTEGSKDQVLFVKTPAAGRYYLDTSLEYDMPTSVDVEVWVGSFDGEGSLCLAVGLMIFAYLLGSRYSAFEKRRKEDA